MIRFTIKVCIFFSGIALISSSVLLIPPKPLNQLWFDSIYDKHAALKEDGQKIVLLGGSNVAFGILSPLIEKSFGIKPVNMGLHAGIGLKYMLDEVEAYINKNDIVILIPEYSHFFGSFYYGQTSLLELLNRVPQNILLLNMPQVLNLIGYLPDFFSHRLTLHRTNLFTKEDPSKFRLYRRSSFNKYGDVVGHWHMRSRNNLNSHPIIDEYNPDVLRYIVNFQSKIQDKEAKFYISFPSIEKNYYAENSGPISTYLNHLESTSLIQIGEPNSYIYSKDLFLDTSYHLTKDGQQVRTNQLIQDIQSMGILKEKR